MINSSQTLSYDKEGFDGKKYISLQKEKILERISKFKGKLYLEIGGKFMFDAHASRVLPGFIPESKKIIFYDLRDKAEMLFCVNAIDVYNNRQITNEDIDYTEHVKRFLLDFENNLEIKPKLVINRVDNNNAKKIEEVKNEFEKLGYEVYRRYMIEGYPTNSDLILSNNGFGKDDYVKTNKDLVLVTGIASSSGKMSTCLGQIYLDYINGIESGYAKYETFPIWNIDLNHPVNLAYEAATADIGDYNAYDELYEKKTGEKSVNYNRDIEAFSIIKSISSKFLSKDNYMGTYDSPTEMGISNAGFCIIDDKVCSNASLEEIKRRKIWYEETIKRGEGNKKWIDKCIELQNRTEYYIKKKYN